MEATTDILPTTPAQALPPTPEHSPRLESTHIGPSTHIGQSTSRGSAHVIPNTTVATAVDASSDPFHIEWNPPADYARTVDIISSDGRAFPVPVYNVQSWGGVWADMVNEHGGELTPESISGGASSVVVCAALRFLKNGDFGESFIKGASDEELHRHLIQVAAFIHASGFTAREYVLPNSVQTLMGRGLIPCHIAFIIGVHTDNVRLSAHAIGHPAYNDKREWTLLITSHEPSVHSHILGAILGSTFYYVLMRLYKEHQHDTKHAPRMAELFPRYLNAIRQGRSWESVCDKRKAHEVRTSTETTPEPDGLGEGTQSKRSKKTHLPSP